MSEVLTAEVATVLPTSSRSTNEQWIYPKNDSASFDDLPYDDGDKMESPWHYGNATMLVSSYVAARKGQPRDYYIGANMFVYFRKDQVEKLQYRGPDIFIVKNVDGTRHRNSWKTWEENGRYPDVIFELLSESTEHTDLTTKKQLYEEVFGTSEYFCVAPEVQRLMGWRLIDGKYREIESNEAGWLWSEQLELWIGPWYGEGNPVYEWHVWLRMYHPDKTLVLLPDEEAQQRAEIERQRADLTERLLASERQRTEAERQRADDLTERLLASERQRADLTEQLLASERERADVERERADAERERADAERERADLTEQLLAALKAELAQLRGQSS